MPDEDVEVMAEDISEEDWWWTWDDEGDIGDGGGPVLDHPAGH